MTATESAVQIVISVIVSLGGSGLLIWIARAWILEKLKNSIKSEYDMQLETHKAHLKAQADVELERLRSQLALEAKEHDVVFSKWHEKRVAALEVIYKAFNQHLEFLRRKFYFDSEEAIDSIHEFPKTLQAQMLYLDAASAAKISIYQGELLQFWNDAVLSCTDPAAKARIRDRLDREIPGYLPKLQRDINQALDPNYDPERDVVRAEIINFYFSERRAPPTDRVGSV